MPVHGHDRPDELRRKLLKSSALLGGAFAAGHVLPYVKPGSKSFEGIPSAYAQGYGPYFCVGATAEDVSEPPGEVAVDGIVTNITAAILPIPPLGTQIDCIPISTDPLNPTGSTAVAGTDAAGVATFPDFDMTTDWPAPLVALNAVVTFTHKFVDPTISMSTCPTSLTVTTGTNNVPTLTCTARPVDEPNPGEVARGGTVTNITATVMLRGMALPNADVTLEVTSDDPLNPAGTGQAGTTGASGVAIFADFNLGTDFPGPKLPAGAIVTFTFSISTSQGPVTATQSLTTVQM